MKAMEHHNSPWSFFGGCILGIAGYILTIDWTQFIEQLVPELFKVTILGIVGGVAGLVGKKLATAIWLFFNRKKGKK